MDSTWQSRPMGTGMGTSDHIPATIRLFHENFWVLLGAMSNFCVQPRSVIERNWEPIPVSSADTMADRIQFWFNFCYIGFFLLYIGCLFDKKFSDYWHFKKIKKTEKVHPNVLCDFDRVKKYE